MGYWRNAVMIEKECYKCVGNTDEESKDCPRCYGDRTILYHNEEDYFNRLADRWQDDTALSSSIVVTHPCYISMKKMGEKIAPYLLKRMQREKTWLLCLLAELQNKSEDPTDADMAGYLGDLTDAWLEWGIKKNFITKQKIILYSDGACSGNPGPGGFGTIIDFGDEKVTYEGGYELTTNNRMELLGIIDPLERVGGVSDVTIYTDSQYVANAINKNWLKNWIKKDWKTAAKKEVKNQDLWQRFLPLLKRNNVKINWIKGHNEHPENEECDKIAVAARMQKNLFTDFEYEKQQS
jgi:ribonuclease HI